MPGSGRLVLNIGGRWEVSLKNMWEMGSGKLTSKTYGIFMREALTHII